MVRGCHIRLAQALGYAVKHSIVYLNICKNVSPPWLQSKTADVWNTAEAVTILREAATDSLLPLWHPLLMEGMRRGEGLGLRWQDVNRERGRACRPDRRTGQEQPRRDDHSGPDQHRDPSSNGAAHSRDAGPAHGAPESTGRTPIGVSCLAGSQSHPEHSERHGDQPEQYDAQFQRTCAACRGARTPIAHQAGR